MIGFDIDGVIANSLVVVDDEFERVLGKRVFENQTEWTIDASKLPMTNVCGFITDALIDRTGSIRPFDNAVNYMFKIWTDFIKGSNIKAIPIITAREYKTKQTTEIWLNKYINGIFPWKLYYSSNKLEIIEDLKLSFFVEDRHKTCCRLSRYCKTFMVNQPWNVKYNTTANNSITRVNDIKDVYEILEKDVVKKEQ